MVLGLAVLNSHFLVLSFTWINYGVFIINMYIYIYIVSDLHVRI